MGVVCIKLEPNTWEAVKFQVWKIEEAEKELVRERATLELLVSQATGINLEDGKWELDVQHGLLEGANEEPQPQVEQPPTDEVTPRRKKRSAANGTGS